MIVPVLALWVVASAFFAIVGWRTAGRILAVGADGSAALGNARAVGIAAGYSLGTAFLLLGTAWLVLPRAQARGLRWSAVLWVGVTVALLAGRQLAGWPLALASVAAFAIGLEVLRRLLLTLAAPSRDPAAGTGAPSG